MLELDKRGYQIMTHTLRGDTARMVLDTYEQVEKINGPRDRRFRLEHALILSADDLRRVAKLDVVVSAQPTFCCSEFGTNFDPQDKTPTDRWESLEKSGAKIAFGSDWPCTWPPDPFVSIQQAVERQVWRSPATAALPGGGIFDGARQAGAVGTFTYYVPDERISVEEAVAGYTRGSAYARFSEDTLGTLEAGKEADLAVISQDIFTVAHDSIAKTRVLLTMVGGKVVFKQGE